MVYCKQQGIAYSTFHYWARKYREDLLEDQVTDTAPGFIPVRVQPNPEKGQGTVFNQLYFLFPNGIQVMCSEKVHPQVLKTLLNP